jgi:hypothetical protein
MIEMQLMYDALGTVAFRTDLLRRIIEFHDALTRAREERLTLLAQTHLKVSMGGELEISAYDKGGRMKRGKDGQPITTTVVLLPNLHGIEWELERLRPGILRPAPKGRSRGPGSGSGRRERPQEIPELLASAIRYLQSRGLGLGALGLPAIETTAKRVEEPPVRGS